MLYIVVRIEFLCDFSSGSHGYSNNSATVSLDHSNINNLSEGPGDIMNDANNRLNSTSQNDVPPVFSPSEDEDGR